MGLLEEVFREFPEKCRRFALHNELILPSFGHCGLQVLQPTVEQKKSSVLPVDCLLNKGPQPLSGWFSPSIPANLAFSISS